MKKEVVRKEYGKYGVIHTYISYVEVPDEIVKPLKTKKVEEN